MGVNVAAHTRHVFLGSAPRVHTQISRFTILRRKENIAIQLWLKFPTEYLSLFRPWFKEKKLELSAIDCTKQNFD